jgi:hypothetical protein
MNMRSLTCPCCGSYEMLRHIRHGGMYWFCMTCRQEMPLLISSFQPLHESIRQPSHLSPSLET